MKNHKLLTSLATITVAAMPVTFVTACNHSNYEPLTQEFKKQAIEEFTSIVKVPHTTGNTRRMANYLKEYFKSYIEPNSWYEDGYRAGTTESEKAKSSGNICFDIKATDGCEIWPGITLQGHYDMVGAGTLEKDTTKGVDAVVDGHIMHSRHYESTLGADDGIGLGIIATIVKNQDKFKHGPLRILLTSDEEADTSGAITIPTDDYDMIKYDYVINLDAEVDKRITVSCASTYSTKFHFSFTQDDFKKIDKTIYPYKINISGLQGGHSANNINECRLSAIKIAAEILQKINYSTDLNVISIVSTNKSNEISKSLEMTFWSDSMMIDDIRNIVINPLINNYKKTNPIETDLKIEISETKIEPGEGTVAWMLTPIGSWKLYTLLNDAPFGPYEWIDKDLKETATSNNLCHLSFDANASNKDLSITSFARSCYDGDDEIMYKYIKVVGENIFGPANVVVEDPETSPAWTPLEKNELFDIFEEGFKNIGINPTKRNAHSWLECAYLSKHPKHKDTRMIAVGPSITDSHTVKETLYLDTLDPLISSLLYTLTHINKI